MYNKLRKDIENQVKGTKMKVDGNVHSRPNGTSPLKMTAGLPLVYPNKKGFEKDGTKPDNPKVGNPKNGDDGKVGQSGSTAYVETNNETKKESDVPASPKKRKSTPNCDNMEIDTP
eukprot:15033740-Ditylum_brightwellii.AAC.1